VCITLKVCYLSGDRTRRRTIMNEHTQSSHPLPIDETVLTRGSWGTSIRHHSGMDLPRQVAPDQSRHLFGQHQRLAGLFLRRPDLNVVADQHRIISCVGEVVQG